MTPRTVIQLRLAALLAAVIVVGGCTSAEATQGNPLPSSGLSLATIAGVSFDYPTGWTLTPVGHLKHYEDVLAFLTSPTATASESCGPEYIPGAGGGCTDLYTNPAGSVVIRLSSWGGPPMPSGAKGVVAADVAGGWVAETVGGQPAAYTTSYSDRSDPPGATVAWFIASPASQATVYSILATTSGPDDPALTAIIERIVASIRFVPAS
jgi:hypothetical protein